MKNDTDTSDTERHVNQNKLTVEMAQFECGYCVETSMERLSYEDEEWVHYTCGMPVGGDAAERADQRLANGEGEQKYPEAEAKAVAEGLAEKLQEAEESNDRQDGPDTERAEK